MWLAVGVLLWSLVAQAQVENAVLKEAPKALTGTPLGWSRMLSVGANASIGTSDHVIGQPDGQTNTYGLNLDGQLNHLADRNEWRHSLKMGESASRTPALPRYGKVKDEAKLESLFLHTLEATPWFGPYVRAAVEAPLLKGEDLRSTPQTYEVRNAEGSLVGTSTGNSLRLTDGFRPLTWRESTGGFFKMIERTKTKVEGRLGVGAQQTKAAGSRVVADVAATPNLEVKELDNFEQVGVEGAIGWHGQWDSKSSYALDAEFLSPFHSTRTRGDDRSLFELTNWELKGRVTTKIYEWLALDYSFKIFRVPQLLDRTQSQTLLLFNLTYQVF